MLYMLAVLGLVSAPALAVDEGSLTARPGGGFQADPLGAFDGSRGLPLYNRSVETGSRYNPGAGGVPPGSGTQANVTFDDVPIPVASLGGFTWVDVTKVTVGIRRSGTDFAGGAAPLTDVTLYWAKAQNQATAPDTHLKVPFNTIGTAQMAARTTTGFITELVTMGDGVTPLFQAPLNMTLVPGYGTFMLGMQLSDTFNTNPPGARQGWRITSGLSANADIFWDYDTDQLDPEHAYYFGGNPVAAFYIIIEGTPVVPEPATLALLSLGSMTLIRRRR